MPLDKPADMTSAEVVSRVKRLLGARKVGHGGTLDPFATGTLICCVNRATRIARFFLNGDKTYQAVIHLGVETDTQDPTGTVVSRKPVDGISASQLRDVIRRFEGTIEQAPPAFSALKHHGVRLYKLARKGVPVKKPPRKVRIDSIEIMEIELPRVYLKIACSSGTYVRSLATDIGTALGCGGHLSALRRTMSSGFGLKEAVPVSQLEDLAIEGRLAGMVIGMAQALRHIPTHVADDRLVEKIRYGRQIGCADIENGAVAAPEELATHFVKVVNEDDELLAILSKTQSKPGYRYCGVFQ